MASEMREIANFIAQIVKAYTEGQAENSYKASSEYVISRLIKECGFDLDHAIRQMEEIEKLDISIAALIENDEYKEIKSIMENVTYVIRLLGSFREDGIVRIRTGKNNADKAGGAGFTIGR